MKFEELFGGLEGAGAVKVSGRKDIEIFDLSTDSRTVRPGSLFAALPGQRQDGHSFLSEAAAAGAVALLVQEGRLLPARANAGVSLVEAGDVREVLGIIAGRFYSHPSEEVKLVGVTGTNGKTTVTYLLEAIFQAAGWRPGVLGTIDYRWGGQSRRASCTTPEAVELQRVLREMVEEGVEAVAMEVSSHALELRRVQGCRFQVAVFTNLGRDHLDFHADLEHYFRAKSRLFLDLHPGCAVINRDDPWGKKLLGIVKGRVTAYGLSEGAGLTAREITADDTGLRFRVISGGEEFTVRSPLLGRPNVYNILAALAAALELGADVSAIQAGIASVKLVPGRFEKVSGEGKPLVLVDYAHTPEAIENALRVVRGLTRGSLILVFGCGGDRDRGKRPLMGRAGARLADLTILTSDNPRNEDPEVILQEIEAGFRQEPEAPGAYRVIPDRRQAIREAVVAAGPGDLVLIAGKGHEDYQVLREGRVPFSDREEAVQVLQEVRK